MFHEVSGEIFRSVKESLEDSWLVSYEEPSAPRFVSVDQLKAMGKAEVPAGFIRARERKLTDGQKLRLALIQPLLINDPYIDNKEARKDKIREITRENQTTERRIQRLYYRHLAGRLLVEEGEPVKKLGTEAQRDFAWAINTFYYSAKKMSLWTAYDLLLLPWHTFQLSEEPPAAVWFGHGLEAENRSIPDG